MDARALLHLLDGEVLVIMFDGKGAPTATESELSRLAHDATG
jgi:hypothetical protein